MATSTMNRSKAPIDPREVEPKQPYPEQIQEFPGIEAEMTPRPDYGEGSYKGSGKLEGRVALITGGDSGIGRAVALAYAREGADVLISYFNEDRDAQETAKWVEDAGRKAILVPGDIQDEKHCQKLIDRTVEELGQIDILINNAAFQMSYKNIMEMPSDEFDQAFRTNVYAMFYLCKAAIPKMKPGSCIINTTSVEAYNPLPILLPYATTKGAIATFTKALSQEAINYGIRVNAVAPGPVWTPLIPYSMPQEAVKTFGNSTPIKRAAQPSELAPVYVWLASPEATYISGMIYGVTGGMITA
jgi:NAD(P)-dependent dehydrogenase (short-subunit alcohol dehydrogenase family)